MIEHQNMVTIVVVPRERFSYSIESLNSIYENTKIPFDLIYIDGKSPAIISKKLKKESEKRKFKLLRFNRFLNPNEARNIGLDYVKTKYLVFVDNDVLVKPFWLKSLVECAEETGAAVVGPLTLVGEEFEVVHMAGGTIEIKESEDKRWMLPRRPYMNLPLSKVTDRIVKGPTELLEFHCMFARKDIFDEVGKLDEELMSMSEEDDFTMRLKQAEKLVYFEPNSIISYIPPRPPEAIDLPFFFVRWSTTWCKNSMNRYAKKWSLTPDSPSIRHMETFVYIHRRLAYPEKPKGFNPFKHTIYSVQRLRLSILENLMNWKASFIRPISR